MRYLYAILFIICFANCLQAQGTRGRVLDFDTGKPIEGASIYLSGTYQGTTSDASGTFVLYTEEKNIPLIISYVGYIPETITGYSGKVYKVLLKHKDNMLKEVTVGYDAMSREDEMKIFMREFIGLSHKCTITNASDISFSYHKKDKLLVADVEQPLHIQNKDLGYTITYFMDNFSFSDNIAAFHGEYFFKEDTAGLTPKEIKKILKNRNKAYFGSRMHFIRSLWANDLDKQGFSVEDGKINYSNLVMSIDGQKYVQYIPHVLIGYESDGSYMQQLKDQPFAFIAANGFYEGNLIWRGAMGDQRVGDLLPFEFQPVK